MQGYKTTLIELLLDNFLQNLNHLVINSARRSAQLEGFPIVQGKAYKC